MGLFGFKKRPKKKWVLVKAFFDNDIWPDKSVLATFMSDFGEENDEYELTKSELLDKDIYHKVYEYTFEGYPIDVKEDGTVFLPEGIDADEMTAVARIHDENALQIIRSGTVTKYQPYITGGPYKELDISGELIESYDRIDFRVYIYYTELP